MNSITPISIVVVTDNHYMIMLAALCKSIEVNHRTNEPLHFYIIADGVSKANQIKLESSFKNHLVSFIWFAKEQILPSGFKLPIDKSSYPLNIYLRLFIPSFLPNVIKKAIYLDVDMLMLTDISQLWNIDIESNLCGAVQDALVPFVSNEWGGIKNYGALGMSPDLKYLNSGLLVFNLDLWRKEGTANSIFRCIEKNKQFANYPDQYGLNVVLAGRWKELESKWNYFASGKEKFPYNIHFTGRKPFYKSYSNNIEYQQLFYKFLKDTKWHSSKPIAETNRYLKKIGNITNKISSALTSKLNVHVQ